MDEEKAVNEYLKAVNEYLKAINWLRNHVAPDDIYEFAQQALMTAQYAIGKLHDHNHLMEEVKNDSIFAGFVTNLFNLHKMKESNFDGIVDIFWGLDS